MIWTKQQRFGEFLRRLQAAPPAASGNEARRLLEDTLSRVEEEFSGVPCHPESWLSDGRMYPPKDDQVRDVPGRPDVKRFRNRQHNTFIAVNGAIAIVEIASHLRVLDKAGADGKRVHDEEPK